MVAGDSILIRAVEENDVDVIYKWRKCFDFKELYCFKTVFGTDDIMSEVVSDKKFPCDIYFMIVDKEYKNPIGECILSHIDYTNKTCLCSVYIGDEEMRDKGYGSEAIRLTLDFAFNELGLNRAGAWISSFNKYGMKCFKKCGFKVEGIMREGIYSDGRYHDMYFMGILKSEYNVACEGRDGQCSKENM